MDVKRMETRNDMTISYHGVSEEDMMFWGRVFSVEVSEMKVSTIDCDSREYVVLRVKLPDNVELIFYGKREGSDKLSDALANLVESHRNSKAAREAGLEQTIDQINKTDLSHMA